jgi:hypothetical protein
MSEVWSGFSIALGLGVLFLALMMPVWVHHLSVVHGKLTYLLADSCGYLADLGFSSIGLVSYCCIDGPTRIIAALSLRSS